MLMMPFLTVAGPCRIVTGFPIKLPRKTGRADSLSSPIIVLAPISFTMKLLVVTIHPLSLFVHFNHEAQSFFSEPLSHK